jgi:hypothetical protein
MAMPPGGTEPENNATDQPVSTSSPWPGRHMNFNRLWTLAIHAA